MHRRDFLRGAALVAAGLSAGLPLGAQARTISDAERFRRGLASHPELLGWADAQRIDGRIESAHIEGSMPRGLQGVLYRNGPGRFSRGDIRYQHWFDGDGLLRAWRIRDGKVTHHARFVETRKFRAEERLGRFIVPAIGTRVPDALSIRNSDDMNTANTAAFVHNGELLALWEGGSAHALDTATLATQGPRVWRDDLVSVPFSAHPLHDHDGNLWNFGLAGGQLLIWRIDHDGRVRGVDGVALPFPGFVHAFSMTRRHLLFIVMPYLPQETEPGTPYMHSLRWSPEVGCRALLIDKNSLTITRQFELPAGAAYHFGPARESSGEVAVDAFWYDDGAAAQFPARDEMRGAVPNRELDSTIRRIRLPLASGTARIENVDQRSADFPAWNRERDDGALYSPYQAGRGSIGFSALQRLERGSRPTTWCKSAPYPPVA